MSAESPEAPAAARGDSPPSPVINMSEEEVQVQEETQPIRSAADLQLEELTKRMEEMESKYQKTISELTKANGELWAHVHKPESAPAPEPPKEDLALKTFESLVGAPKR